MFLNGTLSLENNMRVSLRVLRNAALTGALSLVPALATATSTTSGEVWTRWWSLCVTGTLKSCHSIQLQTENVGGVTAVKVTVRNLQGQDPNGNDNTTWSSLNALRFYGTGFAVDPGDGGLGVVSTAGVQGGATNPGSLAGWNRILDFGGGLQPGVLRLNGTAMQGDGTNRRVGGCNLTPSGGVVANHPTIFSCGGEAVFTFTTATIFNAGQMTGAWARADAWNGTTSMVAEVCQTDDVVYGTPTNSTPKDCSYVSGGVTVTPEPVTMALLGTGLFGMAGARLRRKKKTEV